jgi:glycosyltransferase involved in cell wall biosynthesis
MKIVFLGGNFALSGGTERVATIIANQLSEAGHEVVVASVHGGEKPFFSLNQDIRTRSLFKKIGRNLFRAPLLIHRLRRLLKEENANVLIVVESMLALFTIPATAGLGLKHICWEHFNFKNDLGKKGRRVARQLAVKYCDVIVTLTEKDRRYWLEGTSGRAHITCIPNPSPFSVQEVLPAADEEKVVLSVGRLVHIKGYDLLLDAWAIVVPKAPEWKLRILGDGPEKEQLCAQARELGVEHSVEFVGTTPGVEEHYHKAAIFCLSSRFEGFPMVLLEALSYGLPVVSFDCETGPAEILEGTGGRLVAAFDVRGLAENILHFIRSPDERKQVQALSLRKAECYQPGVVMEKWESVISGLDF